MKTPFDGAIRVGQREIDEVRIAISVQVDQLVRIETAQVETDREVRRQRDVATDEVMLSSHAYMARMRSERARLAETQAIIDDRLTQLRAKAVSAYGTFKAIGSAADTWRDEATRTIANSEQGQLDDLATANFIREHKAARRSLL